VARTQHRLTAKGVDNLKAPGLYADGGNLHLRIASGGSKNWIFRYTLNGRTRDAGLGGYPTLRLSDARIEAEKFRRALADGIDPIDARNAARAAAEAEAARAISFHECANAYVAAHEPTWKNVKHKAQWRSTLKTYVFPVIGALPVKDVDTRHVLRMLEPTPEAQGVLGHVGHRATP
jgi:hypothetical protein